MKTYNILLGYNHTSTTTITVTGSYHLLSPIIQKYDYIIFVLIGSIFDEGISLVPSSKKKLSTWAHCPRKLDTENSIWCDLNSIVYLEFL